jgi:hypothetical protein
MRQIDLDYLIITAPLLSSLYVATTGIVMDLFGSPQFFFHRRGGYVSATLTGLHLATVGGFALGWLIPKRQLAELPGETTVAYRNRNAALLYHQWSKPGYALALRTVLNWGKQSEQYKTYPHAERIALPDPRGYTGLCWRKRSSGAGPSVPMPLAACSKRESSACCTLPAALPIRREASGSHPRLARSTPLKSTR